MTNKQILAQSKRGRRQKTPCAWIEIEINPDDFDISGFPKPGESLNEYNIHHMIKQVKEEINESHQKTLRWQKKAILNSFPTD